GTYTYTPTANFSGTDTFTYTVTDAASGEVLTKTVTVTITPVNDTFADTNEAVSTPEDTPISGNVIDAGLTSGDGPITLTGFQVAGDSTVYTDGQTATITGVGTITIGADGAYTFTPVANYYGTVPTVTYSLTDDSGATVGDTSTLIITVTPVVDLTAANDTNTTPEDTPVNGTVVANDSTTSGGTLAYAKATDPAHGTVTVAADGTYTYTPTANFSGTDTFTYTVTDAASGEVLTKTVTVTITPVNDTFVDSNEVIVSPQGVSINNNVIDSGLTSGDGPITLTSFQVAGDSTVYTAGQTATITGVGTITIGADGAYTFTPTASFHGVVPTVTYSLTDDSGATVGDTSTLDITVFATTTVTLSSATAGTAISEGSSIVYTATVATTVTGSDMVVTLSNGQIITIPVGSTTGNSSPVAVRTDDPLVQGIQTLSPVTISTAVQTVGAVGNFQSITPTGTVANTVVDDADPMTVILSSATAGAAITEGGR
ncbi:tandem-95 repeat protein, partial [Polynucleobacter sp. AP-Capit-er-40B-B4]|uniref:tandem-95 repeat protein n=1 Tax=Polynucleobacter sp. AP-Capit-er-40B-B4 TaxID=2576927 RepID=UPI001C0C517D